jgi:hypothetical protein
MEAVQGLDRNCVSKVLLKVRVERRVGYLGVSAQVLFVG